MVRPKNNHRQSIIMLSSPKGGVGKSSLSRNILVLASRAGKNVLGLDMDKQATLATWQSDVNASELESLASRKFQCVA